MKNVLTYNRYKELNREINNILDSFKWSECDIDKTLEKGVFYYEGFNSSNNQVPEYLITNLFKNEEERECFMAWVNSDIDNFDKWAELYEEGNIEIVPDDAICFWTELDEDDIEEQIEFEKE
jgi:hypothetical protein